MNRRKFLQMLGVAAAAPAIVQAANIMPVVPIMSREERLAMWIQRKIDAMHRDMQAQIYESEFSTFPGTSIEDIAPLDVNDLRETLSDIIYDISPAEQPFMMVDHKTAHEIKRLHEWQTDKLELVNAHMDNAMRGVWMQYPRAVIVSQSPEPILLKATDRRWLVKS